MQLFKSLEVWFVVGSQQLYGSKTLDSVLENATKMVGALNSLSVNPLPIKIVLKPLATSADEIANICKDANHSPQCIGLITWMHTFSPAKMWIAGLTALQKPFLHLHTQFNAHIPWDSMDMAFMNLNQAAHGDREFGFLGARLRKARTIVVGHWQDPCVVQKIGQWMRVACAVHESQSMQVARFGDNMRDVAVTEGNKVSAQIKFGYSVNGYALGDLEKVQNAVTQTEVNALVEEYEASYTLTKRVQIGGEKRQSIIDAARIELGIKHFLERGNFQAFTTTFENLYGLKQLPGLAVQRLMQQGYGFAGEGDWKTAALLRTMKVMGGLNSPTSFMEDYTYHFEDGNDMVLGSHMLEVCPTIAKDKPVLDVQPLGIGGKDDPARLLFNGSKGAAINASLIDLGNRFRLIINSVDALDITQELPKLPVARALWKPLPDLATAAQAWIIAGGAHHTVFSQALSIDDMRIYAQMMDIEIVHIGADTKIPAFMQEINWNEVFYQLKL